jgi:hypothetical protein
MLRIKLQIQFNLYLVFVAGILYATQLHGDCVWSFDQQVQYDTGENTTGVDVGDFDGDGFPDIIVANRNTNDVVVLRNDGLGNFSHHSTVFVGGVPRYVVAGDLDGDGDIDAATPNWESETVSILLNDGTGVLTVVDEFPFRRPSCIAIGDLDDDGDLDLVVPHWDPDASNGSTSPGLTSVMLRL